MDSTGDDDPAGELYDLARQLRSQLLRHAALGAWAAPGGATARVMPAPEPGDGGPVAPETRSTWRYLETTTGATPPPTRRWPRRSRRPRGTPCR